jgi:hypothetical protein
MTWWCPACRGTVIHDQADERPNPAEVYRCHACQLDLRFDARTDRMTICAYQPDHRSSTPASGASQRPTSPDQQPKAS